MADDVYNNLPSNLVAIITHQQIRNELLQTLAYDISSVENLDQIDTTTRKNLISKVHTLLEEWMASKNPKVLALIPYNEILQKAIKIVTGFLSGAKINMAGAFVTLNELAFEFQQEMERKYGQ